MLDGLALAGGDKDAEALLREMPDGQMMFGESLIAAPDGRVLAQAGEAEETIYADADLDEINAARAALDTDGHYSRPDLFSLHVNTQAQDGVVFAPSLDGIPEPS